MSKTFSGATPAYDISSRFSSTDRFGKTLRPSGIVVSPVGAVGACVSLPPESLPAPPLGSELPVKTGVVVNDLLATAVPGVFAVGECAEHAGVVYGVVPPISRPKQ